MITWKTGDLFDSGLPAIAHGVNCRGVMGAGIAAEFRRRWPEMYDAYRHWCADDSFWPGEVMPWETDDGLTIFNLATQLNPGRDAQQWMIAAAVGRMVQLADEVYRVKQIGLPLIGCGIGGLTPNDLATALAPYRHGPVDLTVYTLPDKP